VTQVNTLNLSAFPHPHSVAIGTYGVLSYAVAQRQREIGVRMALGAQREQIGAQFLKAGLHLLGAGLLLGLFGAAIAGRVMQSLLYDVSAFHFATYSGTTAIMIVIGLIACWIPALRASRVDPVEALRSE
jgi:ABC-type antimicrobial peptide transport system permease subunit